MYIKLKKTRVLCILISRVIDYEKEFYILKKSAIEENILLLLYISKEHVILYCKALKVFNFKLFSSF